MLLLGMAVILLGGCTAAPAQQEKAAAAPVDRNTFEVAPVFREFYQSLGGEAVLGLPISAMVNRDGLVCQYTVNVLMCRNPLQDDASGYSLAPVVVVSGVKENPPKNAPANCDRTVGKYCLYPDFVKLYDRLSGARYTGRALTRPIYNYERQRVEQYFENVVIARSFDDPADAVALLPVGDYDCGSKCRYKPSDAYAPLSGDLSSPFGKSIDRIGGTSAFGRVLVMAYTAKNGNIEQVLENLVVYSTPDAPKKMHVRPIARDLKLPTNPPAEKDPNMQANMVFWAVKGKLGYAVPVIFDQYIASHGGREIFGLPISNPQRISEAVARQCFENACLEYHQGAPKETRVRLTPLGAEYLKKFHPDQASGDFSYSAEDVLLQVSKEKPQLSSNESQVIHILVLQKNGSKPLANVEGDLTLQVPGGKMMKVHFGPTSASGKATITLDPLTKVSNGKIVPYMVCLNLPSSKPICKGDAFLIWNTGE